MSKRRIISEIAFVAVSILTLSFIFSRSVKTKEQSSVESDAVGEVLEEIIPDEAPEKDFILQNVRKIAHFFEFSILGAEIAAYILIFRRRLSYALLSFGAGAFFALADETIQIFSERGSSVADVWLDFSGFFLVESLIYLVFLLVCFIRKRAKKSVGGEVDG